VGCRAQAASSQDSAVPGGVGLRAHESGYKHPDGRSTGGVSASRFAFQATQDRLLRPSGHVSSVIFGLPGMGHRIQSRSAPASIAGAAPPACR